MNKWQDRSLGDLITVKHGYAFKGNFFASSGKEIVLTPGNFPVGGGLQFRPGKERYYTGPYPPEFKLVPGQLLMVMTNLKQDAPILGSPAFVPEDIPVLHNQRLGLVRIKPGAEIDRTYLYYLLLSDQTRSQLRATATGATVRHTAPERIYQVRVHLPPLPAQRVIGETLAAFDALVNNNRKQVDILEKMAQGIYREWFINFRYPGRNHTALVDSPLGPIPFGWQSIRLGDALRLNYGKALPAHQRHRGNVAVVGSSGIVGWHDKKLTRGPAIVVGRKGNVGNVIWVDGDCFPIDTTYFVESDLPFHFVYRQLQTLEFIDSHAAVPGINREQTYSMNFLLPPVTQLDAYASVVTDMAAASSSLSAAAARLRSMRDLLLPQLIAGAVDASKIDPDSVVESII